jgi:Ca2+-binding RTX toxin-like protein
VTTYSVATLAELKAALATAATNGQADVITLTADLSATSGADVVVGTGGNDLLKIAITDGQTLSIVGGGFTIDANAFGRVLEVSSGTVAISNLTLREGALAGDGGGHSAVGGSALGAGIYNAANLTLTNVTVTANSASGGGGGGSGYYSGGGGGGGSPGSVAGAGGGGYSIAHTTTAYPGSAGSGGAGGAGGFPPSYGGLAGGGGSSTGGAGAIRSGLVGGAGGTASVGGLSVGGGGGGGGVSSGITSGVGGAAVGGIYSTGTLSLSGGSISGNVAAGGGGGDVNVGIPGAVGGAAVGGLMSTGTLTLQSATITGNAASGGGGGGTPTPVATGAAHNDIDNQGASNQAPTGGVSLSGVATQGQTLTAANTLADADGLGTISYQWNSDGVAIGGATSSTFVLGQAQVGHLVTVTGGYMDGGGFAESATSTATGAVSNINDAPTGAVSISGTKTQNQVLTASNTLADADGLGTISYQWKSDGANISGATASTFTLRQAQVGHVVSVTASYTDGGGAAESVTSAGTTSIANVNDTPTGSVTISGTKTQGQTLTASNTLADADGLGTISYQWKAAGTSISGATGSTLTLAQAQVGKTITVTASYTDGFSRAETVTSSSTSSILNINDAPTGAVTISGTATQGQVLTASNTLADADTLGTISYQWKAGGVNISGATGATFTLGQAQVGAVITVTASYTDNGGAAESVTSAGASSVANVNDAPTGLVTISGTATQGQTLTASNTLSDADTLGTISYQWKSDGANISGATGSTLSLTQAEVGHVITVTAGYTDGQSTAESVNSSGTAAVVNVNDAPTGAVSIGGVATQGQVLTASNTLADADGLGTISYQWKSDGADISGATGSTLTLNQAQVGHVITVAAGYTDGQSTAESVNSSGTAAVTSVNDAPTGVVSISGVATQGQILTASNTLADADGLGTISYQWRSDGAEISGATGSTLTLAQAQVGHVVTVVASYTDGGATAELVTSPGTSSISNVNDAPTGVPTLSGSTSSGSTLTAGTGGISDPDGLGAFTYVWKADGAVIGGATAATYTLSSAEVGKAITVTASYLDGGGATEHLTSTASGVVAAPPATPDDPPPPAPTTNGTVDGAAVSTTTTTGADGSQSQTIVVAPVTVGRADSGGGRDTADIPLATLSGVSLVTVGLPVGTGFSAVGPAAPISANLAAPILSSAIGAASFGGDPTQAAQGAAAFLQLNTATPVLVQTITLSGVSNAAPIIISGAATGSEPTTALLIDAHSVPGQTVITLENIDFAVVIGEARVTGGAGSQTVFADGARQYLVLGADDDVLHGGGGDDTVGSAGGDDSLFGDDGDDNVFGGIGSDKVFGGSGDDSVQGNQGDDLVQGNAGDDLVHGGQGADLVHGGQGDDRLWGDIGDDFAFGDLGNDTVSGGEGDDVVQGNAGQDLVQGDAGDDRAYGGQGNDTVRGGAGNDRIWGDLGDDRLFGDLGADTMTGGAGADTFVYALGDGVDWITDFRQAEGDRIEISGTHGAYATAQVGADTVLNFEDGGWIVLANVQMSSLTSGWIFG